MTRAKDTELVEAPVRPRRERVPFGTTVLRIATTTDHKMIGILYLITTSFLATPAAAYITGTSLPVDGGVMLMGVEAGLRLDDHGWRRP